MTIIEIQDVRDIKLDIGRFESKIDFDQRSGSVTRITLPTEDLAYLKELLNQQKL